MPVKSFDAVKAWADQHPLEPAHVDCAIAVMLKILDGKCKMKKQEKVLMRHLYNAVKFRPSQRLPESIHRLITSASGHLNETMRMKIYEQRVLAETMISRPVMKAFKAMIRQQGLFDEASATTESKATMYKTHLTAGVDNVAS